MWKKGMLYEYKCLILQKDTQEEYTKKSEIVTYKDGWEWGGR